jgi:transcriptional regulator with XRE-family HTH domain
MSPDRKLMAMQIKALRERRKLSQEALADRAGIHRVSLANIERGAKVPTLDTLERLSKALQVPLGRLVAVKGKKGGK